MIYAGILAAGKGVRMHRQDLPKPFLLLGEKPIIVHTLEQFFVNQSVGHIVIVVQEDWLQYTEDLLDKYRLTGKACSIISGGANKTESIGFVANFIDQKFGVAEGDVLIAHDAIRPFLTQRLIDDHIAVTRECGAANTAMKMNDSILITDGVKLGAVPSHHDMYAEQTPQSYSLVELRELLATADERNLPLIGESEFPRMWLNFGYEMGIVYGEYFNMKIINPYDLEVANALLKERTS